MTTPLWLTLLPIGISCIALVVSGLTYRLAIKRDEEAREFMLMERQHTLALMAQRLMNEIDRLIRLDRHRGAYHRTKDQLKETVKVVDRLDFTRPTRELRRTLETQYRQLALVELDLNAAASEIEEIIKHPKG